MGTTAGPTCGPRSPASATGPTRSATSSASCRPTARWRCCCAMPSSSSPRRDEPMRDELLVAAADPVEAAEEVGLRPRRLADFVGQPVLKEHLEIILEAARRRRQAADHLLFAGPPGVGKTTMAGIVAAELSVGLRVTSGPAIERAG